MLGLAFMLAPALPAFAKDGWLPRCLSWFQTPDNSLDGDEGWLTHLTWITNRYVRQVLWLCRNPAYGFDFQVLGSRALTNPVYMSFGDEDTSNLPIHSGYIFRTLHEDNYLIFQLYLVKDYSIFGSRRCIRINFGWKVWKSSEGHARQFVCSINPWMKI